MSRYAITATTYLTITVNNPDVIERVTGPGGDEWRSQFYNTVETADDVVEMFAFNAIRNGVHDITRLDGWGDCDKDDVLIEVDSLDFYTETLP